MLSGLLRKPHRRAVHTGIPLPRVGTRKIGTRRRVRKLMLSGLLRKPHRRAVHTGIPLPRVGTRKIGTRRRVRKLMLSGLLRKPHRRAVQTGIPTRSVGTRKNVTDGVANPVQHDFLFSFPRGAKECRLGRSAS
jgi:hypothetical protein